MGERDPVRFTSMPSRDITRNPQNMIAIWKIAPNSHAKDWSVVSKLGCIAIGWLGDLDVSRFKDQRSMLAALERHHGEGVPGCRSGAAKMLLWFVRDIQKGDVVVANDGYNGVVGIGIVKSGYLSPKSVHNPLRGDDPTRMRQARRVDWVVRKRTDVPGGRLFVQGTVEQLTDAKVARIQESYLAAYPRDSRLALQLKRLLGGTSTPTTPTASDTRGTGPGRVATTIYRILRDTELARRVKVLHNYECQVCGHTIKLKDGSRCSEAHHIKPLGRPHRGLDISGNILCLCPNHHAECDHGAVRLSLSSLRSVDGHEVNSSYIDYHNHKIHDARQ